MSNLTYSKKPGGYKNLIVYQQAVIIYDLNCEFCNRYIDKRSRTHDQMIQVFDSDLRFHSGHGERQSNHEGLSLQAQIFDSEIVTQIRGTRRAGRSGKQNIVEGSLEKSLKMNIKLTGVSRGSFGELLEDYLDFLRTHNLPLWDKNHPRVLEIRALRVAPNKTNWSNLSNWSNWIQTPEEFANLMVTLLSRENYLLDQMLRSLEHTFIIEGGYSENLFKKRMERRSRP